MKRPDRCDLPTVEQLVLASPHLLAICTLQPQVRKILHLAAEQTCATARWHLYEMFKQVTSSFVGWHAAHPGLRNAECYYRVIEMVDELLPTEDAWELVDDRDEQVVLQHLRDTVKDLFGLTLPVPLSSQQHNHLAMHDPMGRLFPRFNPSRTCFEATPGEGEDER